MHFRPESLISAPGHSFHLIGKPVLIDATIIDQIGENGCQHVRVICRGNLAIVRHLGHLPKQSHLVLGSASFANAILRSHCRKGSLIRRSWRFYQNFVLAGQFKTFQQRCNGGKTQIAVAPLQHFFRFKRMAFQSLDKFILKWT